MNLISIINKQSFSGHLSNLFYLLLPCLLATWLYAPAFFYGRVQIHGDTLIHSVSVIELNRKMLHEGVSPLWTNLLFGGHPYFAEGQGGFLNPLNFIVALFFHPVTGQHVYQWLTIIVGALGMFLLCRHFRCTREASTFGALAVVFSSYWLQNHVNITTSGALCWIPGTFLCFERWLARPTGKSALWIALSVSLLIFAGYPQGLHGTVIYMAISLIPTLFAGYIGSRKDNSLKQYLLTGVAAMILCVGLSAIQWMPLLELVSWSHRSSGIDIPFRIPLAAYLNGFVFTLYNADIATWHFETIGSALVCFVASLSLLAKRNHRVIGHIMASIFLVILGLEYATPIFKYILYFQVVPGLKYFRIVHIYLGISIVGFGLLSSVAIDYVQRLSDNTGNRSKANLRFFIWGSILFSTWAGLVWYGKSDHVSLITYVLFLAVYTTLMSLIFINKSRWFGHMALMLIIMEIIALQMVSFPFASSRILQEPEIVKHIQTDDRNKDYKLMNLTSSWTAGLISPGDPKVEAEIRKAFVRLSPSMNVLWNIPSFDGLLALPQARLTLIRSKMIDEIKGNDSSPPGARLIDYLGIRYITAEETYRSAGLSPLMMDGIIILENKYALPRVQTYTRYAMASSPEDALNLIRQSKETTLILEPPMHQARDAKGLPASTEVNDPHALAIRSSQRSNDRYLFTVDAIRPAWLFIADTNYPGWQAQIDGHPTPVYSAQVLGKAVFVPAGQHQITVEFKSRSFTIGFSVLLFTLLILLIMGIRSFYLKRRHP